MSEMIERVAAAIWALYPDTDCPNYAELSEWAKEEKARPLARAAIEAMREPSMNMVTNGVLEAQKYPCALEDQIPGVQQMQAGYQAMIDAALGKS